MNTPNNRKSSDDPRGNETSEKKKFIMGKKQSPRKSRAKFIWFKCVTCLKKSKSDSKYCQNVCCSELGTFEWWISGLMLDPLFFLILRLNNACSPHFNNLQIK